SDPRHAKARGSTPRRCVRGRADTSARPLTTWVSADVLTGGDLRAVAHDGGEERAPEHPEDDPQHREHDAEDEPDERGGVLVAGLLRLREGDRAHDQPGDGDEEAEHEAHD